MKYRIFFILLLNVTCSIGSRGVSFKEMSKKPTIEIFNQEIVIRSDNSQQNSALLIYKIEYTLDTIKKVIEIKGFQAANKKYQNAFELKINGIPKNQLDNYKYFWVDPDGIKNEIEEIKK